MIEASVVIVAKDEPLDRLRALLDAVGSQARVGRIEVVIAVPIEERAMVSALAPGGCVRSITVVDNPGGLRSRGLNLAVAAATCPFVVRLDARSRPPEDYVARCVTRLAAHPTIGVVGGHQVPIAANDGVVARGIARALRNPWMLGGAPYRRVGASGAVDTVYLGAFRRDDLLRLGGYDEALEANEDFELCQRYRAAGYTVWLERGLAVGYEARGTLRAVARQYLAFGRAKLHYWKRSGERPNGRQLLALAAASGVLITVALVPTRRRLRLLGTAFAGVAVLDHLGEPAGSPGERTIAAGTYLVVIGSWLAGIVMEALRPVAVTTTRSPASAPTPPSPMPRYRRRR